MDLIAFLNARLSEDEADANEVHWPRECGSVDRDGEFSSDLIYCSCDGPARRRREVEAKRAIVAACVETLQGEESHDYLTEGGSGEEYELARFVLRQLAAAWSNHPDYDPGRVTGAAAGG